MSNQDLYDFEINRFKELLEEDQPYAFKRYGLTLLYSLEPDETFELRTQMGWNNTEGLDYYNLGTIEAEKENLKEAMTLFQKSESAGCEQPELFYNIAVILEENNQTNEAITYYQKYIEKSELWDTLPKSLQIDLDETRDHIKELKGEHVE